MSIVPTAPAEALSDETVLLGIARGNRESFRMLASRYAARLVRFCDRQTGSAGHGDDLAQDVLLSIWSARARFTGGDGAAWIFTLAVNRCRKHNRGLLRFFSAKTKLLTVPAPSPRAPDDSLAQFELNHQARHAINALPAELRESVLLRIDAELDYRSIGQVVGCTEGAARVRVFTAIRRLRAAMETTP